MTTDSGHNAFQMTFRIEQLPDGTFVGKSDNPKLEIKGATPQEVQQKIQQSMGSRIVEKLGIHMAVAITGDGVEVTGTMDAAGGEATSAAAPDAPAFAAPVFRVDTRPTDLEISGTTPI